MKRTDSNGKLFKKFNIIDVIVIILILAIVVAIAWKTIVDNRPVVSEIEEEEEVELLFDNADHLVYSVVCRDISEEVAKECKAQMELPRAKRRLMSNGEPLEGFITDCTYEVGEDGLCRIYFTMEAVLKEEDGICSVGSQEIRIGKGHTVKTYQIEVGGVIYSMEVIKNE